MNTYTDNFLLDTDSYKASHFLQYPPKTTTVFSYIESRGGEYDKTVFFGLQIYIKKYLSKPITQQMIDEAKVFFKFHGEPFNEEGWQYILDEHDGYLPIVIRAVAEGTVVPYKNVLATFENTDPNCYWLTSYVETGALRAVWYGSTVATNSYASKSIIKKIMEETCDTLEGLPFKLHDFGARGVSSKESAGIGGAAHLVNFMGTDNITGALYAMQYYNNIEDLTKITIDDMVAFSIPAAEHSSITSWGKNKELEAYRNMLTQFAKPGSLVAVVSDSYDFFNAVENIWGKELKAEVINSGATLIVRPDSGDPATVIWKSAHLLADAFGYEINSKGYKVLNHVRIIQGDGITTETIKEILYRLKGSGFSAENVAFGQGGGLLQQLDRDTNKWAMKCSAAEVDGKWIPVYKDPVTDEGKHSKRGRLMLYRNTETNEFLTGDDADTRPGYEQALVEVFRDGRIITEYTFDQVRSNSEVS